MRLAQPFYPVDRYLVRSSKRNETVNILDDDIWEAQPGLKPEDEVLLSKLHDVLQSTADELKQLSEEMSKYHEAGGVQVKALPTPLDQAFNERVRIEQVINAKFMGQTIVDPFTNEKPKSANRSNKNVSNAGCQVNTLRSFKKIQKANVQRGNLGISETKVFKIHDPEETAPKVSNRTVETASKVNKPQISKPQKTGAIAYNEILFIENVNIDPGKYKNLQVQELPKISIRSEMKQQKIFNFDIAPDKGQYKGDELENNRNVGVVDMNEVPDIKIAKSIASLTQTGYHQPSCRTKRQSRKILKLSTCESSESAEQLASVKSRWHPQAPIKQKVIHKARSNSKPKSRNIVVEKLDPRRYHTIDDPTSLAKSKTLNSVYCPGTKNNRRILENNKSNKLSTRLFNNKDYVPYTKLTLGGIRLKDIERETTSLPFEDIPLSPIINQLISNQDKISSDEDSKKASLGLDLPILSASDDHQDDKKSKLSETRDPGTSDAKRLADNDSSAEKKYDDDFEEPAVTDVSGNSDLDSEPDSHPGPAVAKTGTLANTSGVAIDTTFTKTSNLTFKDTVDVIEFIHSIDTQDIATQSCLTQNRLTETQTSPHRSTANVQPIHNNLWPAENDSELDCVKDITKMFQLEKDFIKQLIIEEYGDILKKGVDNSIEPSSSKNDRSSQKNTQTSPARVKSVMTSPRKVKSRTTSPFTLNLTMDQHTSPVIFSRERASNEPAEPEDVDNINLSSPRFSLQLPNHRLVLNSQARNLQTHRPQSKYINNTSTSVDADLSSSEISSLGEIRLKLRRKNETRYVSSCTSSSGTSSQGRVLPHKSEGELSMQ